LSNEERTSLLLLIDLGVALFMEGLVVGVLKLLL